MSYDLYSPAFVADPYPTYARLLAGAPVHYCERTGVLYVVRYRDVVEVLRRPTASVARTDRLIAGLPDAERSSVRLVADVLGRMALFRDPPEQTWLHRAIGRPLMPMRVRTLGPYLDRLADELLDAIGNADRFDVIDDFAYPLPARIVAEMLGADPGDYGMFRNWTRDVTAILGTPTDLELAERTKRSLEQAVEYFRSLVRDGVPPVPGEEWRGSVLRELRAAADRHAELTEDDLIAGCILMVFAGHETTSTLISNALVCLLRNRDQLERLRADDSLLAGAIDETLRYESPVQRTGRVLGEAVDLGHAVLPEGAGVNLIMAAAHRDPDVFDEPSRFDITRGEIPHLAFGYGRHQCPGGALGTIEARAALAALLRRFDRIELLMWPRWEYNVAFRRLRELPVRVHSATSISISGAQSDPGQRRNPTFS